MTDKINMPIIIFLFFFQLLSAQQSADDYFNNARDKYIKGDLPGAAVEIKKAKEQGFENAELEKLIKRIATSYFSQAGEKYTQGNLFGAVHDFESGLELKDDRTAKDILGLCLGEIVYKFYIEKRDYEKAIVYLKKLITLYPDDREYREMYETAKKRVIGGVEALPGIIPKKETQQIERLFFLMETRLEKQEKLLKTYAGSQKELLGRIIEKSRREREMFLTQMKKENVETRQTIKQTIMFSTVVTTAGGIILIGILGVLSIFIIVRYLKKASAVIILGQPEEAKRFQKSSAKLLLPQKGSSESFSEKRAFNIIETELIAHPIGLPDSNSVENLLNPYLESQDDTIVSKASVNLYKHNPEKAIMLLERMMNSPDEKKRVDAVRAFGEIASPITIDILLNNLCDAEKYVKKEIIKTLRKILMVRKAEVSPELQEKIKTELEKLKEKEIWIIE